MTFTATALSLILLFVSIFLEYVIDIVPFFLFFNGVLTLTMVKC